MINLKICSKKYFCSLDQFFPVLQELSLEKISSERSFNFVNFQFALSEILLKTEALIAWSTVHKTFLSLTFICNFHSSDD